MKNHDSIFYVIILQIVLNVSICGLSLFILIEVRFVSWKDKFSRKSSKIPVYFVFCYDMIWTHYCFAKFEQLSSLISSVDQYQLQFTKFHCYKIFILF